MRHFSICLAAVFFLSSLSLAQHSSGGSSSGSSSSGGGGGSHSSSGGSSGGSSSSAGHSYSGGSSSSNGGGHSSSGGGASHSSAGGHVSSGSSHSSGGVSTAHGSGAHGNNARVSNSFAATRSEKSDIRTGAIRGTHEPTLRSHAVPAPPEKRGFFSFLRHPFRHPEPKRPISDLRRPVCLRGPCQVCPNGQVASKGGCGGVETHKGHNQSCSGWHYWNAGYCTAGRVVDDCGGYRMMMQRQADKLHAAESYRYSSCSGGSTEACAAADGAYQSELSLYRSLQARYQQCQRDFGSWASFPGFGFSRFGAEVWNNPATFDWSLSDQLR